MPGDMSIRIDMGKNCVECGKKGAMQNGLCLHCAGEAMTKRGRWTMAEVKTVFLVGDVHPKVRFDKDGIAEHTLSLRLDRQDYRSADAHTLMDMLGERVMVTITLEQGKIPGT